MWRVANRFARLLPQQGSQHVRMHQQQQCTLPQQAWRRLASSSEAAGSNGAPSSSGGSAASAQPHLQPHLGRSLLDSSLEAGDALGSAAEARLTKIAAEAAAAAEAARAAAGSGPESTHSSAAAVVRRVLGLLFDGSMVMAGGALVAGGYYYTRYSVSEVEHMVEETKAEAGREGSWAGQLWVTAMEQYLRLARPVERKVREYTDPSCDKLLPDMAAEHVGRVKTLVLDLNDTLVHKEWTRSKGWQIYKRPGAADFIFQVGQYYEIVIYTDEPNLYADPIINRLDQYRVVPYRLYRQDTQYVNGKHVRDLSKLNRNLSQVLFISEAYEFQPENTLKLKPWKGDPKDTTLLDLIPFLQMVATHNVRDTRDVVRSYDGEEDVAKAFKDRMAHLTKGRGHSSTNSAAIRPSGGLLRMGGST